MCCLQRLMLAFSRIEIMQFCSKAGHGFAGHFLHVFSTRELVKPRFFHLFEQGLQLGCIRLHLLCLTVFLLVSHQ